jgi:hypothetical protein
MNSSNVKIRRILLQNFRGAKELLDLDLGSDCRSCTIFGNNAEGKSTFTQAIEWYYRERIAHLTGEGISEDDIINLASSSGDETFVSIDFNDSDLNASKIFDKKNKQHKFNNTSQKFITYIEDEARYDRLYLDQQTILWFLLRTKGQRKEEIAKIVGYEDIVKVKAMFSSVLHDLEKDPRLYEVNRNISFNQGLMTKEFYGESVRNIPDLINKSQLFLKALGIEDQISDLKELDKSFVKAFQLLPSQERARERVELETLKASLSDLNSKLGFIAMMHSWISSFNILVEDREKVSRLNFYEFLRQAEKILTLTPDTNTCPLCLHEIASQEALLRSVIERYTKLIQIRTELEEKRREYLSIKSTLQDISTLCSHLSKGLTANNISYDFATMKQYSNLIDGTLVSIDQQLNNLNPIAIDIDKLEVLNKDFSSTLSTMETELTKKISGLAFTKEEEERQQIFQKMVRGKDLVLKNIEYEKVLSAYNLLIRNMHNIEDQMLEVQNSTMRQILDLVSEDVNTFFCRLNNKEKIKNVKLETKGEEGIEFTLEFYDNEASPPRKFLSESQLNSLGIAFFLAAAKQFNKVNKFFVLDDVLVSFDRNYRFRLLELLADEFADYQIILLTHEEYWHQMIKKKFPDWVFKEVCWEFSTGTRFKNIKFDQLENIKSKHSKGNKIGNELRIFVESLLKDICGALDVKLVFRTGLDNERRMIGEMLPALTSTLNGHKSDIQKSDVYKDLNVSSFIITCASHDNPDLDSLGDMEETIDKIRKFRELFICPNGRLVTRKNVIPGQDMISCKCGCIKVNWKE